jgi:hypothetical protein
VKTIWGQALRNQASGKTGRLDISQKFKDPSGGNYLSPEARSAG